MTPYFIKEPADMHKRIWYSEYIPKFFSNEFPHEGEIFIWDFNIIWEFNIQLNQAICGLRVLSFPASMCVCVCVSLCVSITSLSAR